MKNAGELLLRRGWLPLLVLLLLVKSGIVISLSDAFFYGEELEKGAAAKAMIDGLAVPHHQLAYHYYEGGGFVASHLTAGAFLLVGQNLLAHKLVAIAFNAGILLVGWSLARRLFGGAAALCFGLLFVFGPESYQKLSLINLGIHFEACLFILGVLACGARILFDDPVRWYHWAGLGVVTGFGIYYSYQVGVVAAWVGALLLVLRPRGVLGVGGLWGLAGTGLGALPLLWMYGRVGDAILDIHGTALAGGGGPSSSVLFREFLASIFVHGTLGDRVGPFVWLGAFVASALFLLASRERDRSSRRWRGLFLLGYAALFGVVYLSSGFVVGEVKHFFYLLRQAPLWVVATLVVGAALGALVSSEERAPRALGWLAAGLLVAFGVRASLAVVATGHPGTPAANWRILVGTKGYAYDQYFAKVLPHFGGDVRAKLELVEGFDEPARGLVRSAAAANLFVDPVPDLATAYLRAKQVLTEIRPDAIEEYSLGLGPLVVRGNDWDAARAIRWAGAGPEPDRSRLLEALGRFGAGRHPLRESLVGEVRLALEGPGREPLLRGVGRRLYRRYRIDPRGAEAFVEEMPPEARAPLREGFEAARRWHALGD